MTLFPDIQKRAQAEVDSVLGTGRLPTLRDRDNLPYIDAVVKELLRWRPIFPLGQSRAVFSSRLDVVLIVSSSSRRTSSVWAQR